MPGAFTTGTEHFPNAGHASDNEVTTAYAELDPLVARNEAATAALFDPGGRRRPREDFVTRLGYEQLLSRVSRSDAGRH